MVGEIGTIDAAGVRCKISMLSGLSSGWTAEQCGETWCATQRRAGAMWSNVQRDEREAQLSSVGRQSVSLVWSIFEDGSLHLLPGRPSLLTAGSTGCSPPYGHARDSERGAKDALQALSGTRMPPDHTACLWCRPIRCAACGNFAAGSLRYPCTCKRRMLVNIP
jgi:hypothetical protein